MSMIAAAAPGGTSRLVQAWFSSARLVKSVNQSSNSAGVCARAADRAAADEMSDLAATLPSETGMTLPARMTAATTRQNGTP